MCSCDFTGKDPKESLLGAHSFILIPSTGTASESHSCKNFNRAWVIDFCCQPITTASIELGGRKKFLRQVVGSEFSKDRTLENKNGPEQDRLQYVMTDAH